MKRAIILFILAIFTTQTVLSQSSPKKWKLVWSDEFNYTGLPDTSNWVFDEGYIRNNEKQYYTVARKENAWVENGMLNITGRKEAYPNKRFKPGGKSWRNKDSLAAYTSAAITTLNKRSFTYGRMEMRAKIPQGLGVWPAFWMLGYDRGLVRWPYCGEIDIMEFVGHDSDRIYGTVHYADTTAKKEHASASKYIKTLQPYNGFHIYAVEWDEAGMSFFFDDSMFHHFNIGVAGAGSDNAFRKPFYILLNLALGGDWGLKIDDANLPQKYQVDWVRVYQ